MDVLKDKGLLTTKTKKESDPDWARKRAAAAVAVVADATNEEEQDEEPATDDGVLALAVDLSTWKLAKPVVQKPGKR